MLRPRNSSPNRTTCVSAIVMLMFANSGCVSAQEQGLSENGLAFVGVDVLTMESPKPLLNQTVVLRDGVIVTVGGRTSVQVPEGVRIVDGDDLILMPGLVDTHIHLRHAETSDLVDYLRAGITCAREMNGRPFLLEWRDQINAGELVGPCLKVAAPTMGNFSSPKEGYPTPETRKDAAAMVRRFRDEGYDWIKIYTFLPDDAVKGVMDESRALGIPVGGHVPIETGLSASIEANMTSIEHLAEYVGSALSPEAQLLDEKDYGSIFGAGDVDWKKIDTIVSSLAASKIWSVPTLVWFDRILPAPMASEAWSDPDKRKKGVENRREVVRRLFNAGALMAIGTDSDAGGDLPASAIHDELDAMLDAGLPAYDVIRLATVEGASLIGEKDKIGTVTVGKRADLLLLSCNPVDNLACLREPVMVVSRGKPVPK